MLQPSLEIVKSKQPNWIWIFLKNWIQRKLQTVADLWIFGFIFRSAWPLRTQLGGRNAPTAMALALVLQVEVTRQNIDVHSTGWSYGWSNWDETQMILGYNANDQLD